jgi:single-strand DNA-binding protein
MAKSLNLCQFIGNLGKDVDMRSTPAGLSIANFSIAVADGYKDKQTGQQVDATEWVKCVAFGKLADICGQYLNKGSSVYVSGRMKTRKYEKDGQTHYATEIAVEEMQMLGGKSDAKPAAKGNQGVNVTDDFDDSVIPF